MRVLFSLLFACTLVACAPAPPTLSPVGQAAFQKTRVIGGLDLLRDTAIAGNEQTPSLISTATTRRIVQFHDSSLKIMAAMDPGWRAAVQTGLAETAKNLGPGEQRLLGPYLSLASTILGEVAP